MTTTMRGDSRVGLNEILELATQDFILFDDDGHNVNNVYNANEK